MADRDAQYLMYTGTLSLVIGLIAFSLGMAKVVLPQFVTFDINGWAFVWFGVASVAQYSNSKLRAKMLNAGVK